MQKQRPVNLDLSTFHFPVTAIVSILHRMSGVLLFFFIPFVIGTLSYSLSSEAHFDLLMGVMSCFWSRLIIWVFASALFYHIVAGIRHLLMDVHLGDSLKGGRFGAWLVAIINTVVIVSLGIYLLVGMNHITG